MNVAVIIPLYNGARWIRETLASVQAQTQPPAEVVVVDDGSEDEGPEIVREEYPEVRLLRHTGEKGGGARNLGLRRSTAPLVAFLDQDDLWHPEHLHFLTKMLAQRPSCPAAASRGAYFSDGEQPEFGQPAFDPQPLDLWACFPKNWISTPSLVLIRRAAFEAIGGWAGAQFSGVVDYHAWLRLSAHAPFTKNRSATVGRRCHPHSHSVTLRQQNAPTYFGRLVAASEDALTHRLETHPEDAERLRRRMRALRAMHGLLQATCEGDAGQLRASAQVFAQELNGESVSYVEAVCGQLWWYLHPALAHRPWPPQMEAWSLLLAEWPRTAPVGRQIFRRRIALCTSGWQWLAHLKRHPVRLRPWHACVRVTRPKAAQRTRRIRAWVGRRFPRAKKAYRRLFSR